jgi:hypothetical protein
MTDTIQWFAGVDWASEIHQVVLLDAQSLSEKFIRHCKAFGASTESRPDEGTPARSY